jgi:hypothetical protein
MLRVVEEKSQNRRGERRGKEKGEDEGKKARKEGKERRNVLMSAVACGTEGGSEIRCEGGAILKPTYSNL